MTNPSKVRLDKNKRTAKAFYDLMFNKCKPREAIERYVGARGRVVEHWDVLQVVPRKSANKNTMF
jgi:predicted SnoaL-like aldol condensation-catalyzing enzyme